MSPVEKLKRRLGFHPYRDGDATTSQRLRGLEQENKSLRAFVMTLLVVLLFVAGAAGFWFALLMKTTH
jgi:hypothetical protein